MNLKVGDFVARKSYEEDVYFKITEIKKNVAENMCLLKGIHHRIQADADVSDLTLLSKKQAMDYMARCEAEASRKCSGYKSNINV